MVEVAAAWACGFANAVEVVEVAVDALVAGVDSTSLTLLAGLTRSEADIEVHALLPRAMEELELPFFGWDDPDSWVMAAAFLAREHTDGRLQARDLCRIFHSRFGHGRGTLIEALVSLDDEFDTLGYSANPTEPQLEQRTLEAALALRTWADQRLVDPT